MTQFHFVAASERFLTEEEPLDEVLRERRRNYAENGKEIDFWLVRQPAFLSAPQLADLNQLIPQPAAAVPHLGAPSLSAPIEGAEPALEGPCAAPPPSPPPPARV